MADDPLALQRRLRTLFVLLILAVGVFAIWTSADFRTAARLFPHYVGHATILVCLVELARQIVRRNLITAETLSTADIGLEAEELGAAGMRRGLAVFGWILGYGALILVLGMPLATVIFVPLLLHVRFRSDWRATVAIVVGLLALMWLLRLGLNLRLPPGLFGLGF
jgi:hypothetical protein